MKSLLLENFETLADAPNAVPKLRELILQLAVRGRLVPQDARDEPASVLLRQVRAARQRLISGGRIGRSVALPPLAAEALGSGLPSGWGWARLVDLGEVCGGATPAMNRPEYWDGDIPWVSPKDMKGDTVSGAEMHVTELALEQTSVRLIPAGSVLVVGRSGILRRRLPVCINTVPCVVNQDLKAVVPYVQGLAVYVALMLRGHESFILSKLVKQGTTVQSLVYQQFEEHPFGLPPLAEQKRIVAKVDELMTQCDELEANQQAKRTKVVALNRASLRALTEPNGASLASAWRRVRDHFDHLYATPETVAELRRTVLQLAVMGRLVPQNPNDEPASGLFQRLQAGCERDVIGAMARRPHSMPPVRPNEVPHEIPESWVWVRTQDAGEVKLGRQRAPVHHFGPHMVPYLRVANVLEARIDASDVKTMNFTPREQEIFALRMGDVLLNEGQSYELVGRPAIYRGEVPGVCCFQNTLLRFRPHRGVLSEYALVVFRAYMRSRFRQEAQQTTNIAHLSAQRLSGMEFPLPPTAEQKRIVARVSQLMDLCDDLEARLQQAQANADRLLAATVDELVTRAWGYGQVTSRGPTNRRGAR